MITWFSRRVFLQSFKQSRPEALLLQRGLHRPTRLKAMLALELAAVPWQLQRWTRWTEVVSRTVWEMGQVLSREIGGAGMFAVCLQGQSRNQRGKNRKGKKNKIIQRLKHGAKVPKSEVPKQAK